MTFPGFSFELVHIAAWVFVFGVLVTGRALGWRAAMVVAAIKVSVPLAYFAWNPSGAIHLNDDLEYYYRTLHFLRRGFDFVTLFRDPLALPIFVGSIPSSHIGYDFWNLAALTAFGPHYHAPVFLNVGLSFLAGGFFHGLLAGLEFDRRYRRAALAFFLLHWNIVAWSSFINLKDMLALTLLVALMNQLLAALRAHGARKIGHFTAAALLAWSLAFVRFYVPMLLAAALPLYALTRRRGGLAFLLFAALAALAAWRLPMLQSALSGVRPEGMVTGLPRILVTPLPWRIIGDYDFLFLPSMLDLLLLLPALASLPFLWRSHPQARLPLIFLALALLLYASAPVLQGPRQRFQVGFLLIWMQFHALRALFAAATDQARAMRAPRP